MDDKVLFLDRDGVVNHDPGDYTCSVEDFQFVEGIISFLKGVSEQGYRIIGITNQGGIAKGRYSIDDFLDIDRYMTSTFRENGIHYLETFFCPHHHEFGKCICRKPESGMLEKAMAIYGLQPQNCLMIGDSQRDIDAASKVGVRGILVPSNSNIDQLGLNML